ncbi:universal stress protein [Streptomyces sp. enrichment culture]|uniref:universal stress protein n=1 Tax=Streptomyces sp. enrichment culture TaxID=1795815 RepID=UPI003F5741A9
MTAEGPSGTVLVGLDDTPHAWLAADWAAREAELRGAGLRIVHAVPVVSAAEAGTEPADQADARVLDAAAGVLDDARARTAAAHPGLRTDSVLGNGLPAEVLLDASHDADLIVVGTRGRGGFSGLLLGSVSLKTAAHADRPVVIVRAHTEKAAHGDVVIGVRDEGDEEAVRFGLAEAALRRTTARLVHAWTPLTRAGLMVPQVSQVDAEQRLHQQILEHATRPAAEYPEVPTETVLAVGSAAGALVEASEGAALVVVPRHPPAGRLGMRLGSVVHALVHHALCPVAVVPTA